MLETRYQVWLLDHDGDRAHVFSGTGGDGDIATIDLSLVLNDVGMHNIGFNISRENIAELGDLTVEELLDYQVVVMAYDRLVDDDWTEVYRGFHRGLAYSFDDRGTEQLSSLGRHVNDLLAAESIRYPHGNTGACKSGACESIAKRYVFQNIGAGAEPEARQRQGVQVQADGGTGRYWEGCRGDRNLLEVVQELADTAPADFMMVPTGDATFQFQWRHQKWGLDRRVGNTDGNKPMLFSPRLGNCASVQYRKDHQSEANVVYLLGAGAGSLRHVLTLHTEGFDSTPWSRRAISRDGRKSVDDLELQAIGVSELIGHRAVEEYTITMLQTAGTRWRRDWNIGDLVTCEHRGQRVDQQIIGVKLGVDPDGVETVQAMTVEIRSEIEITTTSTSTTTTLSTSSSTSTTSTSTTATTTSTTLSASLSRSLTKSDTTTTSTTTMSTSVTTVSMSISVTKSITTSTSTTSTSTTSSSTSTTSSTSTSTTTLAPLE